MNSWRVFFRTQNLKLYLNRCMYLVDYFAVLLSPYLIRLKLFSSFKLVNSQIFNHCFGATTGKTSKYGLSSCFVFLNCCEASNESCKSLVILTLLFLIIWQIYIFHATTCKHTVVAIKDAFIVLILF